MKSTLRSPWLTVTLAIIVMSIGYVSYVKASGLDTKPHECPSKAAAHAQQ